MRKVVSKRWPDCSYPGCKKEGGCYSGLCFEHNPWPPKCWRWAWDNMPKRPDGGKKQDGWYDGNDAINWHDRNKVKVEKINGKIIRTQMCPFCSDPLDKNPS